MFRMKCPRRRSSTAPPAQCTMNARSMMARTTTTSQKKNTTIPGMAYPATVLALVATAASYPAPSYLFRKGCSSRFAVVAPGCAVDGCPCYPDTHPVTDDEGVEKGEIE